MWYSFLSVLANLEATKAQSLASPEFNFKLTKNTLSPSSISSSGSTASLSDRCSSFGSVSSTSPTTISRSSSNSSNSGSGRCGGGSGSGSFTSTTANGRALYGRQLHAAEQHQEPAHRLSCGGCPRLGSFVCLSRGVPAAPPTPISSGSLIEGVFLKVCFRVSVVVLYSNHFALRLVGDDDCLAKYRTRQSPKTYNVAACWIVLFFRPEFSPRWRGKAAGRGSAVRFSVASAFGGLACPPCPLASGRKVEGSPAMRAAFPATGAVLLLTFPSGVKLRIPSFPQTAAEHQLTQKQHAWLNNPGFPTDAAAPEKKSPREHCVPAVSHRHSSPYYGGGGVPSSRFRDGGSRPEQRAAAVDRYHSASAPPRRAMDVARVCGYEARESPLTTARPVFAPATENRGRYVGLDLAGGTSPVGGG